MEEIKGFLEEQNEKIRRLYKKANLSCFNAIVSGKEELYKEYEENVMEMENFFHNKDDFEKIKDYLKEEIKDDLIKRQLDLLYLSYLGSQGNIDLIKEIVGKSTKIEQTFNKYRAKIKDKEFTDNEIKKILREETDSKKLREVWEASKKQGAIVEKETIEIIKLRNELAKSLGFKNYFEMSLELNEQSEGEIEKIFSELKKETNEPFKKIKEEIDCVLSKRYNIEISELKPWHYQDLFFQEAPDIYKLDLDKYYQEDVIEKAIKFYDEVGLDVRDILEKSDLYEKPKKYQHACCFDIDREGDVRIVQSTKNDEYWMNTTLHELGHGVYSKYQDFSLPFLLKGEAHIFTTEAIALFFERTNKNSSFLKKYCNVTDEEAENISKALIKKLRLRELIFSRWSQVMFNFERELYENPEQDLNKLWWNLVKKYQGIDFSRDNPDWASKIHVVSAPVYYHNYILGELLGSQIKNHLCKEVLNQNLKDFEYTKEVGEYLKEKIFMPGKKYKWDKLIKKATGEKLTPKYFIEEFCN